MNLGKYSIGVGDRFTSYQGKVAVACHHGKPMKKG